MTSKKEELSGDESILKLYQDCIKITVNLYHYYCCYYGTVSTKHTMFVSLWRCCLIHGRAHSCFLAEPSKERWYQAREGVMRCKKVQLTDGLLGSTCGSSLKWAASRIRFTAPIRKPSTPFPSQKRIISWNKIQIQFLPALLSSTTQNSWVYTSPIYTQEQCLFHSSMCRSS